MRSFNALVALASLAAASPIATQSENPARDLIKRARAVNYNQNYIASGAGVTYTPNLSAGSFSVSYDTKADFVVGLGWQPGDAEYVAAHPFQVF